MQVFIDAQNKVLGRICTHAAKQALLGNKVVIFNCEKAVITGNRPMILQKYRHIREKLTHPTKGPYLPRMPDRFVRRTVRGMLAYKSGRGKEAFQRVMCYLGVPKEAEGKPPAELKGVDIHKLGVPKFITIADLCRTIGGKI